MSLESIVERNYTPLFANYLEVKPLTEHLQYASTSSFWLPWRVRSRM